VQRRDPHQAGLSYCGIESGVSEAFLPHVAVTEALKQVWIATRAGIVVVRGATEIVETDAAWSQGVAVVFEPGETAVRDDTAVELP
jgi:hypothetical protein